VCEPNGSIAVLGAGGAVLVSAFIRHTQPRYVVPVLLSHYRTQRSAEDLVLRGDFEELKSDADHCRHFVKQGDDLLDCIPEAFDSLEDYEAAMCSSSYGNNYIFRDGTWYVLTITTEGPRYDSVIGPRTQ